jgi:propionyl-CoA carboxylase alpha chain
LALTLRSPEFIAGDTTTDFIDRVDPPRARVLSDEDQGLVGVGAAMWLQRSNRDEASTLASSPSGWRNARLPPQRVELAIGERTVTVHYRSRRDGTFAIGVDADEGDATVHRWAPDLIDVEWAGRRIAYSVTRSGDDLYLTGAGGTSALVVVPRFDVPGSDAPTGSLIAPMPGVVIDLRVAVGDPVSIGQTLVVLEAMKMEHHIKAGIDGVVSEVHVDNGLQLENGALLLVIEPLGDGGDGSAGEAGEGA